MNERTAMVVMLTLSVCTVALGENTNLGDSFDLGDIRGGYSTSVYTNDTTTLTNMYARIGGQHKVNDCGVSFSPNYADGTLDGYQVQIYMKGLASKLLSSSDEESSQYQSNQFNARGISLSENSWNNVYDEGFPNGLISNAGSEIYVSNFKVKSADGMYSEYASCFDLTTSYFCYNVTWYGDFLPGTAPTGFVAPAMTTSISPVPEPSTFVLLCVGAIALVINWRKRHL